MHHESINSGVANPCAGVLLPLHVDGRVWPVAGDDDRQAGLPAYLLRQLRRLGGDALLPLERDGLAVNDLCRTCGFDGSNGWRSQPSRFTADPDDLGLKTSIKMRTQRPSETVHRCCWPGIARLLALPLKPPPAPCALPGRPAAHGHRKVLCASFENVCATSRHRHRQIAGLHLHSVWLAV